jgi:hypothetical protein
MAFEEKTERPVMNTSDQPTPPDAAVECEIVRLSEESAKVIKDAPVPIWSFT